MTNSILTSVKKMCGVAEEDESFDLDILTHVNTTFSTINLQIGIGPEGGFLIEDKSVTWDAYLGSDHKRFNDIKSYMYLRVRYLFDPPGTSFLLTAFKEEMIRFEILLGIERDLTAWTNPFPIDGPDADDPVFDGGTP